MAHHGAGPEKKLKRDSFDTVDERQVMPAAWISLSSSQLDGVAETWRTDSDLLRNVCARNLANCWRPKIQPKAGCISAVRLYESLTSSPIATATAASRRR